MIHYNTNLQDIDWQQLCELYRQVGLIRDFGKTGNIEGIKKAFEASYKIVTAWDAERLVGAGRLVSDGICYGTVFDLGVLPAYQGRGVGKAVITELMREQEHLCIYLTSTFGNEPFYQKLGFLRHKTAFGKYPFESDYLVSE